MKFFKKLDRKGFTLAEMLIVMAVVVVLAAAAMPTVKNQIESARETNDIDAIRTAYSQAYTQAYLDMTNKGALKAAVATATATTPKLAQGEYAIAFAPTQKTAGWQSSAPSIGGCTSNQIGDTSASTGASTAALAEITDVTFTFQMTAAEDELTLSKIDFAKKGA